MFPPATWHFFSGQITCNVDAKMQKTCEGARSHRRCDANRATAHSGIALTENIQLVRKICASVAVF